MGMLTDQFNKMSTRQLRKTLARLVIAIDRNEGRLTTDSSAQLDFDLDRQDAVEKILRERLAVRANFLRCVPDEVRRVWNTDDENEAFIDYLINKVLKQQDNAVQLKAAETTLKDFVAYVYYKLSSNAENRPLVVNAKNYFLKYHNNKSPW